MTEPVVIDFETLPIIAGSGHAPEPVGVSILCPGCPNIYLGWGHPGYNPNSWEAGQRALADIWDQPLLFHNCKFDIGVAIEHMGLPWPRRCDDTMFQTYLVDPLAKSLGLKALAAKLLGMDPEERDAVYLWLKQNFRGPFLPEHRVITEANAGAYIGYAPYVVVEPYACGDTARTKALHQLLMPKVKAMKMDGAYERELKVAKAGYWMERIGVRVDREALAQDHAKYNELKADAEYLIQGFLGDVDLDKPVQVANALLTHGHATCLPLTPTGRMSMAKAAIEANVTNPELACLIRYRGALKTLTQTFFKGWLQFSERDGYLHPSWNQVKSEKGGTRTGRPSCSEPNLTNVPTEFDEENLVGLDLPFMRRYILPDEGHVIVSADYNGQEMRGMAHYAEGKALQIYREDPNADFHAVAAELIRQYCGMKVSRKTCKIVGFSLIYGSGIDRLAQQLGVHPNLARKIKYAYFEAIPGLQNFISQFRNRNAIKTWGGRIIPVEPAHEVDGMWREFNYKLCNHLIQGSAADQTKEAIVRYEESSQRGRMLITVYDELVISVPEEEVHAEVPILRDAMENMPGWDVPFVAEVEYGPNWFDLEKFA